MRNLAVRTISGAVYLGIICAALLLDKFVFATVAAIFMLLMMEEFFRMAFGSGCKGGRILSAAAALTFFALLFAVEALGLSVRFIPLALIPLLMIPAWAAVFPGKSGIGQTALLFTSLGWIALPMALSSLLVFKDGCFNGLPVLGFFVIIWCSDIGAYCIGTAFGQGEKSRKMCPEISPHKSWAGFWGGLGLAAVAAVLLSLTPLLPIPTIHAVVLGVLMHLFAVAGDLYESRWKRHFGAKDSGHIIPGHGGLLDRLDSTLTAMPAGALYLIATGLL